MAYQNVIKIDQLSPENYDTWKIQVESLLIKNDLWGYVSGETVQPSGDKLLAWTKEDRKAKADILLSVGPSLLKDVKDLPTSKDVWMKLMEIHESKEPARKATLLKRLILTKMKSDDNIAEHISSFFDVVAKLKSIEMNIDDDLLSILLLYSLPEQFENFRVAIESRDELPKPSTLKVKIIEEYNARKVQQSEISSDVLVVQNQGNEKGVHSGKPKGKKFYIRNKILCYICKRPGHKAYNCRNKFQQKEKTSYATETCLFLSNSNNNSKWILDSGATSHMCADIDKYVEIKRTETNTVKLANYDAIKVKGKGTIELTINQERIKLHDVLYVPDLRINLLSVTRITSKNYSVKFLKNTALIINERNEVILRANKVNGLYEFNEYYIEKANIIRENNDLVLWHKRYGHLNFETLRQMIRRNQIRGIGHQVLKEHHQVKCEICIQGKQNKLPFPKNLNSRRISPLDLIHSDICGPIKTMSQGGAKYFITFIDDCTRWCETYIIRNKNQALQMFKIYKAKVENIKNTKIKAIRTDNGREYVNHEFSNYLQLSGIQHQRSSEYTPEQNGIAERMNRTLVEMARCMILESRLPVNLWAEAICTANYIRNRSASRSLNNEIPYKLWKGRDPAVGHFRTFGSLAYVLQKGPHKQKFGAKSKPHYLVGYCENSKAYRLLNRETKCIIKSRDVIFANECEDRNDTKQEKNSDDVIEIYEKIAPINEENMKDIEPDEEKEYEREIENEREKENNKRENEFERLNNEIKQKIKINENYESKRKVGRPRILRDGKRGRPRKLFRAETKIEQKKSEERETSEKSNEENSEESGLSENFITPEEDSYDEDILAYGNEFIGHKDLSGNAWNEAIISELNAHEKNKTWRIVERPVNVRVIGCRWVFTTKTNSENNTIRRKARLVAKGCSQRAGIDYTDTYAPVAKYRSIRLMVAMA